MFLPLGKTKPSTDGFTLSETLLVVSIIVLLAILAVPVYMNFYHKYQLDTAAHDTLQFLRVAQVNAMASRGHDEYGLRIVSGDGGSIEIFKGPSYAGRDTSFEGEFIQFSSNVNISETVVGSDIVFTRVEGSTPDTGTITLYNQADTKIIFVYETGLVELD